LLPMGILLAGFTCMGIQDSPLFRLRLGFSYTL
jgi:hypothetical protein